MDLGLRDKVAFVSGASRGIGLGAAKRFAAEGARVVLTGRNPKTLDYAVLEVANIHGADRVLGVCVDMTRVDEIDRALAKAETHFGKIDCVVANVGSGTSKSGYGIEREHWDDIVNSNLLGNTMLAAAVLSRFEVQGYGSLTFVSSIAGVEAINAPIAYSAAKAGLMMAMKSYANLVGPKGIRVNAVAPGNVLFSGGTWEKKLEERASYFNEYINREVPMRRFGSVEEIADVIVFLASERAAFVTGAVWVVDGGQTRSYV